MVNHLLPLGVYGSNRSSVINMVIKVNQKKKEKWLLKLVKILLLKRGIELIINRLSKYYMEGLIFLFKWDEVLEYTYLHERL